MARKPSRATAAAPSQIAYIGSHEANQLWAALDAAFGFEERDEVIHAVSNLPLTDKEALAAVPELEDVAKVYDALRTDGTLEDLIYELEKRGFTIARLR